jgi:hypothetical protein
MNRLTILLMVALCTFFATKASAQRIEDVIYLSNGSIIHGTLQKDSSVNTIRILNHTGDTWVFDRKDVIAVKREKPFDYKAAKFNQRGIEFNVNGEFLMRSGGNAVGNAVIPGINMVLAYRCDPWVSTGLESGVDFYNWMEIPLSISLKLRTSTNALSPFLLFRTGYTFPAEKRADDYAYKYKSIGGVHATVGIGFERIINENASFLFSASYHYQELNYHLTPLYPEQMYQDRDRTETYSRFRLTLGYAFK